MSFLEKWPKFSGSKLFLSPPFPYQIPTIHLFASCGGAYVTNGLRKEDICQESHLKGPASNSSFIEKNFLKS